MELYFFRHGDSEEPSATVSDAERQLTEVGRRETSAVATALRRAGLRPEIIVTSPLRRARQTAEIIQNLFGISAQPDERLAPGCSLAQVRELARHHPYARILLVGHEPDFSRIVGQLIGTASVGMAKSGLARVHCDRIEPGAGTLIWLLSADLFPEGL